MRPSRARPEERRPRGNPASDRARVSLALRGLRHRSTSAAELAAQVGLAPKRVLQVIDELARRGFVVEAHPHLGLRLVGAAAELDAEELACNLGTMRVGRRVRCVDQTTSTNDLAWEAAAGGPKEADGLAVLAEYQSAGRGRRGNRWLAPPGSSILCSVVVWVKRSPNQGAMLTRAAAVAAAEAVEGQASLAAGIRWPNDIVVEDRKVGGILVEARPVAGEMGPVVIGIGLNCTQDTEAFPAAIRSSAASLATFGTDVDRTLLARALLARMDEALARTADRPGEEEIHRRAAARCRTLGRRITLREGETTYEGDVVDLDFDYGLVLRLLEGGIRRFPAMTTQIVAQ